jgi:peroxiredoxin family protein
MTDLLEQPQPASPPPQTIEKVSIIISRGSLEGIYPGLIMANGARMEGIDANLFFTFFGLDAINNAKHEHVKVATVGNPGLHLATWAGGFPGVSAMVTHKFAAEMEKLDIPPIPEFIEMIADSGAGIYACKASRDRQQIVRGGRSSGTSVRSTNSAANCMKRRTSAKFEARPSEMRIAPPEGRPIWSM